MSPACYAIYWQVWSVQLMAKFVRRVQSIDVLVCDVCLLDYRK